MKIEENSMAIGKKFITDNSLDIHKKSSLSATENDTLWAGGMQEQDSESVIEPDNTDSTDQYKREKPLLRSGSKNAPGDASYAGNDLQKAFYGVADNSRCSDKDSYTEINEANMKAKVQAFIEKIKSQATDQKTIDAIDYVFKYFDMTAYLEQMQEQSTMQTGKYNYPTLGALENEIVMMIANLLSEPSKLVGFYTTDIYKR